MLLREGGRKGDVPQKFVAATRRDSASTLPRSSEDTDGENERESDGPGREGFHDATTITEECGCQKAGPFRVEYSARSWGTLLTFAAAVSARPSATKGRHGRSERRDTRSETATQLTRSSPAKTHLAEGRGLNMSIPWSAALRHNLGERRRQRAWRVSAHGVKTGPFPRSKLSVFLSAIGRRGKPGGKSLHQSFRRDSGRSCPSFSLFPPVPRPSRSRVSQRTPLPGGCRRRRSLPPQPSSGHVCDARDGEGGGDQ